MKDVLSFTGALTLSAAAAAVASFVAALFFGWVLALGDEEPS